MILAVFHFSRFVKYVHFKYIKFKDSIFPDKIILDKKYNTILFFRLPSFAEILIFKSFNMEVITIESQAFRDLTAKIGAIAKFVAAQQAKSDEVPADSWVDSYEVCTFLKISAKTLQRLRATNTVVYSRIRGKNYYRISEIERLLKDSIIRRNDEHLQDLIKNHQLYVEQRRNTKANG
jgi:hypothetical protein